MAIQFYQKMAIQSGQKGGAGEKSVPGSTGSHGWSQESLQYVQQGGFIHYECVLIKTTFNNTAPVAEAGTPTEELGVASPSKGRGHSMKGRGQS